MLGNKREECLKDGMVNRRKRIISVFQILIGIAVGIGTVVILVSSGDITVKWIGTLVLGVLFAILGVLGIFDSRSKLLMFFHVKINSFKKN